MSSWTRRGFIQTSGGGLIASALASGLWGCGARENHGSGIVIGGVSEDAGLDPNLTTATDWLGLLLNMYETLVIRGADGNLSAGLATSWRQIDSKVWEFSIREGVKFHQGQDFGAEDVVFTYQRILDPKNSIPQRPYLSSIDKVEAIGGGLKITLKYADPAFLQGLLLAPIISRSTAAGSLARSANGTGPYSLVGWTPADRLTMKAAEGYWGVSPAVKNAVFRSFPEASSLVAALRASEVDIAINLQPDVAAGLDGGNTFTVRSIATDRSVYIILDNAVKPLDDARVRRAINIAIDRTSIAKDIMLGNATPVANQVGPMYRGYNPDLKPVFNPQLARQLLTEAGYPTGVEFTLNAPSGRYVKDREVAEALVGQWAKVGIRVKLQLQEFGTMMTRFRAHQLSPAYFIGYSLPTWDSGRALQSYFTTDFPQSYFRDASLEAEIKEAVIISDEAKRSEALRNINKRLYDQDAFVYLYQQKAIYGIANRLMWNPRSDERVTLSDIGLAKS